MEELAREIEDLLGAIDESQIALATVYQAKRAAIRQSDGSEIHRLTTLEESLVTDLQVHLRRRQQILQRAKSLGWPADSLATVVRTFDEPRRDELLAKIQQTQRLADANRRESWILWIVCKQSLRFFSDVIELIANGGRRAPVYLARSGGVAELSTGGALLDAKA
jgi:flagellar biosynthesis/type III secretory pathway chaperone